MGHVGLPPTLRSQRRRREVESSGADRGRQLYSKAARAAGAPQGCIADTSAPAGLAPAKATGLRAELKPAEGKQQRQELTQQPAEALAFLS